MMEFNELERSVLDWIAKHQQDPDLVMQIKSSKLSERKWTKVGFYLTLEVPRDLKPYKITEQNFQINGPKIESSDIDLGGGALLWGKDGYINQLELFSNGSFFNEQVKNYKIN